MVLDLEREVEGLKKAKLEIDKKAKDLERKIGVLEMKETEEKARKLGVVPEKGSILEEKLNLGEALRESEEKTRSMESNILKLQKKVKEAKNIVKSFTEKANEAVNEAVNEMDNEAKAKGLNGLKPQWPVVAASTGAIAAAAVVIFVCYGKRT
ncbi:peroxisomal and mitochondrial division factor 1-like [Neltuma alba]|uniref:peroxisomal and mitochondrial division factor 1-like n=1 Tax=Neltuma alba TaxID=207710 RepID=UPI0010A2BA85|nr:peroxisomal and mitochondrial division factor 1-like [Prosopis alba]